MDKPDFTGARVMVCGLMRSGMAAARLLLSGGADICVADVKPYEQMDPLQRAFVDEVKGLGAELYLGGNPDDIINRFNYIVISPGIPIDTPFIEKARDMGIPVIGELELGSMVCDAPIIAFTGTNGKTSASTIAGDIMKIHAPGSETLGNIGAAFCEKAAKIPRDAWVTLEVSSFQLESVRAFRPHIAAVLNIKE
ncbi:MAG: UDP-N-acetylmuramoyl-L-alanine--D-glutamate ligase, partial [Clostridiales bacterium]|nr:UDP-N-acetylmuramoyl-L-alanine--D-glutamate ligase [Clostridiales bacterium]